MWLHGMDVRTQTSRCLQGLSRPSPPVLQRSSATPLFQTQQCAKNFAVQGLNPEVSGDLKTHVDSNFSLCPHLVVFLYPVVNPNPGSPFHPSLPSCERWCLSCFSPIQAYVNSHRVLRATQSHLVVMDQLNFILSLEPILLQGQNKFIPISCKTWV